MEDYEKLYKDVLAKAREIHRNEVEKRFDMEWLFPELADSNDERIRKALLEMVHDTTGDELWVDYNVHKEEALAWLEKQGESYTKKDVDDAYLKGICDAKHELEKQGTPAKLSEEEQNKFAKGVLSSCALSFINYLDAHKYEGKMCVSNLECEDIENAFHNAMWDGLHRYYCKYIEKQGEQKSVLDFKASNWYVSKVDGKIHDMTYNPADKVEPRFKVKYAGSEYNVLEVKDIAGVTFYGIEDEPNHIDYIKAENCEIISGYAIKENGSPYPTKPAVFSEKKPTEWSEEDENYLQSAENACEYQYGKNTSTILWLKSLKDRIGG